MQDDVCSDVKEFGAMEYLEWVFNGLRYGVQVSSATGFLYAPNELLDEFGVME